MVFVGIVLSVVWALLSVYTVVRCFKIGYSLADALITIFILGFLLSALFYVVFFGFNLSISLF